MNPSMRLKVKTETFYLPDQEGGVYFRNNIGSFRMTGTGIEQWIEKLLPVFNGDHTMESLTDGLPEPYRRRVYEIAETLYTNGFVRDVSQDHPHQLSDEVLRKFSSQIEFLDSFGGSGAYRFQKYREAKVLAIGSGPMFVSLIASLLESGMPKVHMRITDAMPTNRARLDEHAAYARETDPEVRLREIHFNKYAESLRDLVQPYDAILYVSSNGDVTQLSKVHAACRKEKKAFLPACIVKQAGMAGPIVRPDSDGCWESAFRRVHESAINKDPEIHSFSNTAGALLSNVIVFALFKTITGVTGSELNNKCFLLDLETLEGGWHSFLPHPLVNGHPEVKKIRQLNSLQGGAEESKPPNNLVPFFLRLTSAQSGIFHIWEEGDLIQLPLSQCRVQPTDPLSEGPAQSLPEIIGSGLTHEEARRNSGFSGIEAYISRICECLPSTLRTEHFVGVGAGETPTEGICRGLQKCLDHELHRKRSESRPAVVQLSPAAVEDSRCLFYMRAVTTLQGEPVIGLGEDIAGFPVMWVGTHDNWYGSSGLNRTLALQNALEQALLSAQNNTGSLTAETFRVSSVNLVKDGANGIISEYKKPQHEELLQTALQVLKQNRKEIRVYDLTIEPFLKEELAGVYGVSLAEEGSR